MSRSFALWARQRCDDPALAEQIAACFATRGKRAPRILANAPTAKGRAITGAWRALMLELCPQRAGMYHLVLCSNEERSTFYRVQQWLDSDKRNSLALRLYGQNPYEFSMEFPRVDRDLADQWFDIMIDPDRSPALDEVTPVTSEDDPS